MTQFQVTINGRVGRISGDGFVYTFHDGRYMSKTTQTGMQLRMSELSPLLDKIRVAAIEAANLIEEHEGKG